VLEPDGGAHRSPEATIRAVGEALQRHLSELSELDGPALRSDRYARFRNLGAFLGGT
jgi:acetyl-CoA carboxylase carboxyl transferase subunit alpha